MSKPRHRNIKSPFEQRHQNLPHVARGRRGSEAATRAEQLAELDRICAARPLKPPPHNFGPVRSYAAQIDARKARK